MSKKKRITVLKRIAVVAMVTAAICVPTVVKQQANRVESKELYQKKIELQKQQAELEEEREEIQREKTYMTTDEYAEKMAREKFGLVYDDEIVFQAK